MSKFTKKNSLTLFKDGVALTIVDSLHEAGEKAEDDARVSGKAGEYEVRVQGGLYHTINVSSLVLDDIPEPPPPPPPPVKTKWNPSNYYKIQGSTMQTDQQQYFNSINTAINSNVGDLDGTEAEFAGVLIAIAWGALEVSPGVWDFTALDKVMANLVSRGKRMLLMLTPKSFGNAPRGLQAPPDLFNEIAQNKTGYWTRLDKEQVMTRFIACLRAIAEHFDSHPNFEGILTQEPTPSWGGSGTGFKPNDFDSSNNELATQLIRMYTALKVAFTKSVIAPSINHLSNQTVRLMEACYSLNIGIAAPDTREVTAWLLFAGVPSGGETPPRDYRGQIPRITTVSTSSWSKTSRTDAEIITFSQEQKCTHTAWISQSPVTNKNGQKFTWESRQVELVKNPTVTTVLDYKG